MYIAKDSHTAIMYRARNVQDLCDDVEGKVRLTGDLPPGYLGWSNSRRITYLVEAGYIIPFEGPNWFMNLSWFGAELHQDDKPKIAQTRIDLIDENGSPIYGCRVEVTQWPGRNHVRLVIHDDEHVIKEMFCTEEGLHRLWVCLGRIIGLPTESLMIVLNELPPPRIYTPQLRPELFMGVVVDKDDDYGYGDNRSNNENGAGEKKYGAPSNNKTVAYGDYEPAERQVLDQSEALLQEVGNMIESYIENPEAFSAVLRDVISEYRNGSRPQPQRKPQPKDDSQGESYPPQLNDSSSYDDYQVQH